MALRVAGVIMEYASPAKTKSVRLKRVKRVRRLRRPRRGLWDFMAFDR